MRGFKPISKDAKLGDLVFVRVIRNVLWDENLDTEVFEYEDTLRAGFILDVSRMFEDFYLVKFFDGEQQHYWAPDLFQKKEQIDLTYLDK
tara:strand:+ start:501 stop:770 length:270 start_codon:yes stop_codon:yes gene_type:complete